LSDKENALSLETALVREERKKQEGPAVIAGPSQSAGKFGVAFRSFGA
jgi:hypothetical protein